MSAHATLWFLCLERPTARGDARAPLTLARERLPAGSLPLRVRALLAEEGHVHILVAYTEAAALQAPPPGCVFLQAAPPECLRAEPAPDLLLVSIPVAAMTAMMRAQGMLFDRKLVAGGSPECLDRLARMIGVILCDLDAELPAAIIDDYVRSLCQCISTSHYLGSKLGAQRQTGGLTQYSINKIHRYVTENLQSRLSLEQLAKIAGLSRFHFCRAFKLSTGLTPQAYIRNERLNAAIRDMEQRSDSLADIACRYGFGSQQALLRAFKKSTGVTPGAYRRLQQAAAKHESAQIHVYTLA